MEALEAIFTRRSLRKFTERKVDKAMIEKILKAGMQAPSAGNEQPWHFVVITDRTILEKLPTLHPHARMCLTAAAVIVPCIDHELETHQGFAVQDLSAATENMLLAIHALGMGAVWVGVHPRKEREDSIKTLLKLPENVTPFCLIPLGYSDMQQKEVNRFQESRVHYNEWSSD